MKIALVEDNEEYSNLLYQRLVNQNIDIYLEIFDDGESFLVSKTNFDFIILDIELPGIDGIEISKLIVKADSFVIFLTSLEDRVFEAFGENVIGYLLKSENFNANFEKLQKLLEKVNNLPKINVRTPFGSLDIQNKNIVKICKEKRKMFIYTITDKIQIYDRTLEKLYAIGEGLFIYPNQSSLINADHIVSFDNYEVLLCHGVKETISRSYLVSFKKEYLKRKIK
ncbi:MAG: response regulator [Erysipelotrichales bacterium]|nr:response regulator [Erysipelotrichales bacterium]